MRLFIAALLPDEIRARMDEYIGALRSRSGGVKWEQREKLHVTLKFLGSVEDSKVPDVSSIIDGLVRNYSPFETDITGYGGFPDMRYPRILYIGLSENPELSSLQGRIDEALEPLGFPRETRGFLPHVTIGRIKSRLRIIEPFPIPEKCKFTIDEIAVVKSETRRDGSVYTPLHIFRLR
ncbi:MAG TPA: RNA 2',3'-cyclic phosphodiesterase [Thermodesulfobacteriota bacterium]|nr:RNA 2',3'-cyclic phosphodiesterase [Thermodesulfobacteriota bacterium]